MLFTPKFLYAASILKKPVASKKKGQAAASGIGTERDFTDKNTDATNKNSSNARASHDANGSRASNE